MAVSRYIARLRAKRPSCLGWLCEEKGPHPGGSNLSVRREITLLLLMVTGATALYLAMYHKALLQSTAVYSLPRLTTHPDRHVGRKELAASSRDLKTTPESRKTATSNGTGLSEEHNHTALSSQDLKTTPESRKTAILNWPSLLEERNHTGLSSRGLKAASENIKTATLNESSLLEERNQTGLSSRDLKAASDNLKTATLNESSLLEERNHTGLSSRDLKAASDNLKTAILKGSSLPLLTLFSTWTDREDLETMRNLTLRNWSQLRPFIQPLLFTNSSRLAAGARSYGWEALPVSTAAVRVPVLKFMYLDAMKRFNSSLYCFANGDILFTSSLVDSLLVILSDRLLSLDKHPLLAIGQRTNVANVTDAEALTFSNISKVAKARGKLFVVMAEDYFITDRRFDWESVPDVVIGRTAYDNWLVMHAIQQRHVVVDMTQTALAVHQTTRFGNFEGWTHANSSYNRQLLEQLYNRTRFAEGYTNCTPWRTLRTEEGDLVVAKDNSP